ncbi:MAG TPA: glutamate--tRNA ligase, partial [Pseudomonadales bacterium]|nr:glutamate--tRNA ligase [Pseudomonadales bacterium]
NGRWLREELSDEAIVDRMAAWAYNRDNLLKVIPLVRERIDTFSDVAPLASFFVEGLPKLGADDLAMKNMEPADVVRALQFVLWELEALGDWERDAIQAVFTSLAERMGLKIRDLLAPVFVAISGKPVAPPLYDSIEILGPDLSRARVRHAIEVLGGVSNKQSKRLEKEYRSLAGGDAGN